MEGRSAGTGAAGALKTPHLAEDRGGGRQWRIAVPLGPEHQEPAGVGQVEVGDQPVPRSEGDIREECSDRNWRSEGGAIGGEPLITDPVLLLVGPDRREPSMLIDCDRGGAELDRAQAHLRAGRLTGRVEGADPEG